MKMKTIAAFLLATLSMASASAASYGVAIIGTPTIFTNTNLSSPVSFTGFNTSLGRLDSVTISIDTDVKGKVVVFNDSNSSKSGYVALQLMLGFGSGTTAQTFYSTEFYNQNYTLAGGSDVTLGRDGSVSGSATYTTGLDYFKTNSVTGTSAVKALSSAAGGEDVAVAFTTKVLASGHVTYNYTALPVPEPETYGMLLAGLALVGVVAQRKRNKSNA